MKFKLNYYPCEDAESKNQKETKFLFKETVDPPDQLKKMYPYLIKKYPYINSEKIVLKKSSSGNYMFCISGSNQGQLVISKKTFEVLGGGLKSIYKLALEYNDLVSIAGNIEQEGFWFNKYVKEMVLEVKNRYSFSVAFNCPDNVTIDGFEINTKKFNDYKYFESELREKLSSTKPYINDEEVEIIQNKYKGKLRESVNAYRRDVTPFRDMVQSESIGKVSKAFNYRGIEIKSSYGIKEFDLKPTKKDEYIVFYFRNHVSAKYNIITKEFEYIDLLEATLKFLKKNQKAISFAIQVINWIGDNHKNYNYDLKIAKKSIEIIIKRECDNSEISRETIETGEPFVAKCKRMLSECEKKVEEETKAAQKNFLKTPYIGTFIGMAVCRLIDKNEKGLSSSLIMKILRDMSLTYDQKTYAVFSDKDRIFNTIPAETVEDVIQVLYDKGIVSRYVVDGTYGRFYVYKPTLKTPQFIAVSLYTTNRAFDNYSEVELLAKIRVYSSKDISENTWRKYMEALLDHPGIYCEDPEAVGLFLRKMSDEYRRYLETLRKLEDVAWKKKYIKKLIELSKENS